eukprot:TRINITY_DN51755_c0_g1_i1.p1 TRINITY_DN51755_c0_g1~~TRINITY_DN51755_c0_g1_i1.p1  ORF type:complete len:236 (+),score=28.86 TRINITY_DN51755_c0_g1_i1:55-762(+)
MAALDQRGDLMKVFVSTGLMSFVSGMTNVISFYELGMLVSHMTGNTSHAGRHLLASGDRVVAARFAAVVGAFIAGSAVVGACESTLDKTLANKPSHGLMGSSLFIYIGMVLKQRLSQDVLAMLALSFSQGLLNGVSSQFSSLPIRTTHATGSCTDIGLILGQLARGKAASIRKLQLLVLSVVCFGSGGFTARLTQERKQGMRALLIPAILLLLLGRFGTLGQPASEDAKAKIATS